jgi:hypothetical protein
LFEQFEFGGVGALRVAVIESQVDNFFRQVAGGEDVDGAVGGVGADVDRACPKNWIFQF